MGNYATHKFPYLPSTSSKPMAVIMAMPPVTQAQTTINTSTTLPQTSGVMWRHVQILTAQEDLEFDCS
jgi:hypothetical protein